MSDFIIENNVLTKYIGKEEKVIIPEGVTKIATDVIAFKNFIKEIVLPSSLIEIEDEAFLQIYNLTEIYIPSNVKQIGTNILGRCFCLEKIIVDENNKYYGSFNSNCIVDLRTNTLIQGCTKTIIPSCVNTIGQRAFWKHHRLSNIEIPESVKAIEKEAFFSTGISSLYINKNIESISDSAFLGCFSLKNLTVDNDNKYYESFNCNAIVSKPDLRLILVGNEGIVPKNVRLIGKKEEETYEKAMENLPFYNCDTVEKIEIPDTVEYVNMRVFECCDNLKEVYWKGKLIDINN